jgi:hypothetical protein
MNLLTACVLYAFVINSVWSMHHGAFDWVQFCTNQTLYLFACLFVLPTLKRKPPPFGGGCGFILGSVTSLAAKLAPS